MDEPRRFLRLMMPGVVFMIEVALLLFVGVGLDLLPHVKDNLTQEGALATVITITVGSGGVGYLLSVLHHLALWRVYVWFNLGGMYCDFRSLFEIVPTSGNGKYLARLRPVLEPAVSAATEGNAKPEGEQPEPTVVGAWRFQVAAWHGIIRQERREALDSADDRFVRGLCDTMHGAGAMLIGAILAVSLSLYVLLHLDRLWTNAQTATTAQGGVGPVPFWVSWPLEPTQHPGTPEVSWWGFVPLGAILIGVHLANYGATVAHAQRVTDMVFRQVMRPKREAGASEAVEFVAEDGEYLCRGDTAKGWWKSPRKRWRSLLKKPLKGHWGQL